MSSRSTIDSTDTRELKALERHITRPKNSGGDVRVHLVYPNSYWIAMSNLGFQAVYSLFGKEEGVLIERGFLPDNFDDENVKSKSWRTFETSRNIADCDILAFSLSFETDYPHLLKILRNQRLLALGSDARDKIAEEASWQPPIIIAGGTALTLNPEPVADFIDVAVLGEAEELIPEFVAAYRAGKSAGKSRAEVLKDLAQVEGVYVPRFYHPVYQGNSVARYDVEGGVPPRPQRRFVKDISKFPTYTNILTPETEFKSMFLTETGRGCEMGCRFCVAGYIYRPVRKRSEESLADTVKIGLENSDAVGFVGAAVSSHKSIAKLASSVAATGARASLSSLMSQKVNKDLAASLSESEYKTVALAPEAGTNRLRRAAGKRVKNEQVIEAASDLAEAGIRGFKLYFIVGLPTETEEDVDAIGDLAIAIRDRVFEISKGSGKLAWVQLSVNPFIPKACTPFQWEPMLDRKVLDKKIDRLRERIRRIPNLEMRFEPPKESYFQALLSRGDRRVAQLLLETEVQGKDWKWLMKAGGKESLLPEVPPIDFYVVRRIPYDEFLPWDAVDSRIDKKLLKREAQRAHLGEDHETEGDEGGCLDTTFSPAQPSA